jgi:hypothetical protein
MSPERSDSAATPTFGAAIASVFLLALAAALFSFVRPTNFGGTDEWLSFSLLSRGILEFPYANRPLNLVWGLPGWSLFPDQLVGFLVFHALWIGLGGVLVFLVIRRLLPGAEPLAFVTGALAIVWAPTDGARLCAVHMIVYSGCTFGVLLALWLTLEAWLRRRPLLAAVALAVAGVSVLSIETALAPLALVPVFLLLAGGTREPRRLAAWTLAVLSLVAAAGLRIAVPILRNPERASYQASFAEGLRTDQLIVRSFDQLRRHVTPLVRLPASGRPWPAVPIGLAVFAAGFVAVSRGSGSSRKEPSRRQLLVMAAVGCLWALVSYLPLAATTRRAFRTQFLSTPGVAALLAAGLMAAASFLPRRARRAGAGLLGAGVVALGVGHTAALQARLDEVSAYPGQRQILLGLTALAPDLAPGTLVVLLQGRGAWALDLAFRHAVLYLYEGRATGHVAAADPLLYETRFEAAGIRSIPRPALQGPWGEGPVLHPYNSVVAVREDAAGRLRLLETWPDDLPPLPAGASYAPRSRLRGGPPPRRLSILRDAS